MYAFASNVLVLKACATCEWLPYVPFDYHRKTVNWIEIYIDREHIPLYSCVWNFEVSPLGSANMSTNLAIVPKPFCSNLSTTPRPYWNNTMKTENWPECWIAAYRMLIVVCTCHLQLTLPFESAGQSAFCRQNCYYSLWCLNKIGLQGTMRKGWCIIQIFIMWIGWNVLADME